jgi:hypothetical protein
MLFVHKYHRTTASVGKGPHAQVIGTDGRAAGDAAECEAGWWAESGVRIVTGLWAEKTYRAGMPKASRASIIVRSTTQYRDAARYDAAR